MEDYRFHSFRAKAGHHVNTGPGFKLEWQEIMQHHIVKTRLLDWTESAVTALLFALEPLIQPGDDPYLREMRRDMDPVLWLLNPRLLNSNIYDIIAPEPRGGKEKYELIKLAFEHIAPKYELDRIAKFIGGELHAKKKIYFFDDCDKSNMNHYIDGLINLSAVETACQARRGTLYNDLKRLEINPFHYVLLRIYSDGLAVDIGSSEADDAGLILPPLATIHQYHSPRIQTQRGVFLVAPHYNLKGYAQNLYDGQIDLRSMDMQIKAMDCLLKVRIVNPQRIARDLLNFGERRSSIYPELDVYAKDMEGEYCIQ